MKKTIRISENQLIRIIKKVINEETSIVTNFDRAYDYKKDGDKFYFKGKKGKYKENYPDWTLATTPEAIDAIKTKVFGSNKSDDKPQDKEEKEKSDKKPDEKIEKSIEKQKEKSSAPSKRGTSDEAISFLMKKGLTKAQSAGIAGNLYHESRFNPTVKPGDGGTSFGIAQWHNERGDRMKSWTKQNGHDSNTFSGQLEYLWWELQNAEKKAYTKLKETDNPTDAAFAFAKYFERCSACQDRNRIKGRLNKAQEFFDSY